MADSSSTTATSTTTDGGGFFSKTTMAIIAVVVLILGVLLYTKMKAAPAANAPATPKVGSGTDSSSSSTDAPASNSTVQKRSGGLLVNTNPVDPEAIALRKGNLSQYEPFRTGEWNNDYNVHLIAAYGDTRNAADIKAGTGINYNGAYVDGFMKGMNLRQTVQNFNAWKPYIDKYMNNDNKQFHWDVQTIGQYLK